MSQHGRWRTTTEGDWTGGFWVGQLWLLWRSTGEESIRQQAERFQALLAARKDSKEVDFDLGFLYRYSFGLGYDLTGEDAYREIALGAADRLLTMAHPKSGIIYYRYPHRVERYGSNTASSIVDVMLDLSLLWWAYRQTGAARFRDAAESHARVSVEWFVREDGSTVHVVDFDLETGEMIRRDTHQGLSRTSCWSRGQAWAVYGFLEAFRHTRSWDFLRTCRALLDYWRAHTGSDPVPPWDFGAGPDSRSVPDTSAAAILCAALARALRHGIHLDAPVEQLLERTVRALIDRYLSADTDDGVLTGGCWHFPAGWGINEATVWGDYFLLEALTASME